MQKVKKRNYCRNNVLCGNIVINRPNKWSLPIWFSTTIYYLSNNIVFKNKLCTMYVHPFIKNILEKSFYIHLYCRITEHWVSAVVMVHGIFIKCIVRPSEFGGVDCEKIWSLDIKGSVSYTDRYIWAHYFQKDELTVARSLLC